MKLNILFSPSFADELFFTGKTSVVIDVMRATTVITTALHNGAREVIPVNSIEFAMKVSGNAFGGQVLLGGERHTKKIEGFSLGNSPSEYGPEAISGKSIILYTTNGSRAIVKAKYSKNLLICCLNNLDAVADKLIEDKNDIEIICAGSHGTFCIEDSVCAGMLAAALLKRDDSFELSDATKSALVLAEHYHGDLDSLLRNSEHGRLLVENGFGEDITYCAELNSQTVVPSFLSGTIKLYGAANESGKA